MKISYLFQVGPNAWGACTSDRALLLAGNYGDRASKIKVRCKTFVDCVPSSVLPRWVWIHFFLVFFQVEMWPNNSTGEGILPTLSDIPTELQNRPGAALLGMCQHRRLRMSSLILCFHLLFLQAEWCICVEDSTKARRRSATPLVCRYRICSFTTLDHLIKRGNYKECFNLTLRLGCAAHFRFLSKREQKPFR